MYVLQTARDAESVHTTRTGRSTSDGRRRSNMQNPGVTIQNSELVSVRAAIPRERSRALDHLAVDLGVPKRVLLADAALLLLRHHGRAEGLALHEGKTAP